MCVRQNGVRAQRGKPVAGCMNGGARQNIRSVAESEIREKAALSEMDVCCQLRRCQRRKSLQSGFLQRLRQLAFVSQDGGCAYQSVNSVLVAWQAAAASQRAADSVINAKRSISEPSVRRMAIH